MNAIDLSAMTPGLLTNDNHEVMKDANIAKE